MKSPELRKELSELLLHKRGIRINLQLAVIESEDEILLRSNDEVFGRLLALSALYTSALSHTDNPALAASAEKISAEADFSRQELACLRSSEPGQQSQISKEALRFLAWCCGLQAQAGMPELRKNDQDLAALIQQLHQNPEAIRDRIRLRSKSEILDWADLLYRLHWAVRHAQITGKPTPGRLDAQAVHDWHKVVNWLIRFEDEDDWDLVSTETAG